MSGEIFGTRVSRLCKHCLIGFDAHVDAEPKPKCLYHPTSFEALHCALCFRVMFTHYDVYLSSHGKRCCVDCGMNNTMYQWTLLYEGSE